MSQCFAACCSVLQRVTACCSMKVGLAACHSVLQRIAMFCSVLQYEGESCHSPMTHSTPSQVSGNQSAHKFRSQIVNQKKDVEIFGVCVHKN